MTDAIYHRQVFEYLYRGLPPGEKITVAAAGQWSPSRREDKLDKGINIAVGALMIAAAIALEADLDPIEPGHLTWNDHHAVYVTGLTARSLIIGCFGFKQEYTKVGPPELVFQGLNHFNLERDLDRLWPLHRPGTPNAKPGLIAALRKSALRIQFATCTRFFPDNWQRGCALLYALESMRARRAAVRVANPLAS